MLVARPRRSFSRLGDRDRVTAAGDPASISGGAAGEKAAASFRDQTLGIASAEVWYPGDRKSISKETTFEEDVRNQDILHDVLRGLAAEVAATARGENLSGSVVTLKIRFVGFETHTRQRTIPVPTHDERVILREAWARYSFAGPARKPVRLIGWVSALGSRPNRNRSTSSINPGNARGTSVCSETIDRAADRFGKGILQLGYKRKINENEPR